MLRGFTLGTISRASEDPGDVSSPKVDSRQPTFPDILIRHRQTDATGPAAIRDGARRTCAAPHLPVDRCLVDAPDVPRLHALDRCKPATRPVPGFASPAACGTRLDFGGGRKHTDGCVFDLAS